MGRRLVGRAAVTTWPEGAVVLGGLLRGALARLVSGVLIRVRGGRRRGRRERCGVGGGERRSRQHGRAEDPSEDHRRGDDGRKNDYAGLIHATDHPQPTSKQPWIPV